MGTTADVKKDMPGLQLRVEDATKAGKTAAGTQHGIITLRCEFTDPRMWDEAIKKLNGFKIFGELAEEIVDALGAELDKTMETLEQAKARCTVLEAVNVEKEAENTRLRGLLQSIEDDLEGHI